jgi:hypothetical protein
VTTRSKVSIATPNGSIEGEMAVAVLLPDRTRIEMTMLGQRGMQVLNGDLGWASNGGQVIDLSGEQKQAMKDGLKTQVVPLLVRLASGTVQAGWAEEGTVGTETVDVLTLVDGESIARASFGRTSGLLLRLEQEEPAMFGGGKVPMARLYTDYRAAGGLQVPYRTERFARGERLVEDILSSISINSGVTETSFLRPAR